MEEKIVGLIKNIEINEDTEELEITIKITDKLFQRKILRDLTLSGNLSFEKDKMIFRSNDAVL